jgi:hypothetical protein
VAQTHQVAIDSFQSVEEVEKFGLGTAGFRWSTAKTRGVGVEGWNPTLTKEIEQYIKSQEIKPTATVLKTPLKTKNRAADSKSKAVGSKEKQTPDFRFEKKGGGGGSKIQTTLYVSGNKKFKVLECRREGARLLGQIRLPGKGTAWVCLDQLELHRPPVQQPTQQLLQQPMMPIQQLIQQPIQIVGQIGEEIREAEKKSEEKSDSEKEERTEDAASLDSFEIFKDFPEVDGAAANKVGGNGAVNVGRNLPAKKTQEEYRRMIEGFGNPNVQKQMILDWGKELEKPKDQVGN